MEIEMMKPGLEWPEEYEHESHRGIGVELLEIHGIDLENALGSVLSLGTMYSRGSKFPFAFPYPFHIFPVAQLLFPYGVHAHIPHAIPYQVSSFLFPFSGYTHAT
jgi:hypothetical protein